jgi:hypothetical protein
VQEFNNLRAAAQNAAAGTSTVTSGLRDLRNTSLLAREGMNGLTQAAILAGGTAFPELARGVLLARDAMMVTRSVSMLTGASILAVAGSLAVIASSALPEVYYWWQMNKAAEQEADSVANLHNQTLTLQASLLKQIAEAQKVGLIDENTAGTLSAVTTQGDQGLQNCQCLGFTLSLFTVKQSGKQARRFSPNPDRCSSAS